MTHLTPPNGVDRRAFLTACAAVAAALARPWPAAADGIVTRLVRGDTDPDGYRHVLRALIPTILPFEHPSFPQISVDAIEARLLGLFPLGEERYAAVRQALLLYNEVALFPTLSPPIVAEERGLIEADEQEIRDLAAHDARLYAGFLEPGPGPAAPGLFIDLAPARRTAYLRLWGQSAFEAKRRFYRTAKRLVVVTAYSTEELWRAIGYAGPLVGRSR